jgi:aminoglycoside phosphotransferase (APT) family kinase protein
MLTQHQPRGCTMSETIGPLLAAGNVAEVFEWGSRVVKLYRSPARKPTAFREAAIHAAVEAMALPVPAVWGVLEVRGRWGIVFDRVKERSFAERMREDPSVIAEYLETLVRLHARIHSQPARQLGSLKSKLATNIAGTRLLDDPLKQNLLGRLADMPEGDRLCHGDFHPANVLGQNSLPVVIDWPDACCGGDPAADVCRSCLLLKLHAEDIAEPYLDTYCSISNMPRASILDWMPYVAAARLAEEVPDDWARLLEIVHA